MKNSNFFFFFDKIDCVSRKVVVLYLKISGDEILIINYNVDLN